ncbi:MAG: hypothetical protein NVSMB24_14080 [Mucilaginibacter sp.]
MNDENTMPEPFEHFKLMYDNVYDELNRSRDWPIKIMAFASAAYFALYSIIKIDNVCGGFNTWVKIGLLVLTLFLTASTLGNIYSQHKRYQGYRDIQTQLENKLKIHSWKANNKPVFPVEWQKLIAERNEKQKFGLGWHFYAIYIIVLALIEITLILLQ